MVGVVVADDGDPDRRLGDLRISRSMAAASDGVPSVSKTTTPSGVTTNRRST
jgi:hypothetical protein